MTHQCPRPECSRRVPDSMFACRGDWYALPEDIRERIWAAWRAGDLDEHAQARADAVDWYREHPPRYATRPGMVQRYRREPRPLGRPGRTGDDRQ